jgi:ATPase subunit of ABC transporter with duplicated ATPase domains
MHLVSVDRVTASVEGRTLFADASFGLTSDDRVGVVGPNGSGKTTLFRLVVGALRPDSGIVRLGVEPGSVAYLDQAVRNLRPGRTVLECFQDAHPAWDEGHARHVLARYRFPGDAALAAVGRLSGGERMRAGLACVLGGPVGPALLLLDEPTNHLDFRSLEVVEHAVAEFDGALLVASHDADFLRAVGVERELVLGVSS